MHREGSIAALIPVKAFGDSKSRLRSALDDSARTELAKELATGVVKACQGLDPHVICEDEEVAEWATGLGAAVIEPPLSGLNRVVRFGVDAVCHAGFSRALVAHADLADPTSLRDLAELDGVVLVPDLAKDGTNVVLVPTGVGFGFSYGPNSFARHLSEAERLGGPLHVVIDGGLALDLDDPADLELYDPAGRLIQLTQGSNP